MLSQGWEQVTYERNGRRYRPTDVEGRVIENVLA
jgi:hypothetical protein